MLGLCCYCVAMLSSKVKGLILAEWAAWIYFFLYEYCIVTLICCQVRQSVYFPA